MIYSLIACSENIRVETALGTVEGEVAGKNKDIAIFKGIPYALPPVGHRRWASPVGALSWSGVRYAKYYSPACPQQLRRVLISSNGVGQYMPQSEDCLYLNVFAPTDTVREKESKLPVLFVIHGGGRVANTSASMEMTKALANEDIIVVTANYRLGIFSFFAHPELSAESPHGVSGNYGTLDLIEALKWVQTNITSFGGDPNKVTIAGASGGGTAVGVLIATPLSKGLFRAAAAMCSDAGIRTMHNLNKTFLTAPSAEELGVRFMQGMGVENLTALRRLSAQKIQEYILSTGQPFSPPTGAGDVVDGWVFPQQILDLHKEGLRNKVPIMLGFNADEYSYFGPAGIIDEISQTSSSYNKAIKARYGDLAEQFLTFYPPADLVSAAYDVARDRTFTYGVEAVAKYSVNSSAKAYLYYMAHRPPNADKLVSDGVRTFGVSHCTDFNYFFNSFSAMLSDDRDLSVSDLKLQKIMSNYLVYFIKTGNPNHTGAPIWKSYNSSEEYYMRFEDGNPRLAKDLLPGTWELHEKIKRKNHQNGLFGDG